MSEERTTYYKVYGPRLREEYNQLSERLTKLRAFFDTETFLHLSPLNKARLLTQAGYMAGYKHVLYLRLEELEEEKTE